MKTLYLIRHGESVRNVDETACPMNPDLSAGGVTQATALAESNIDFNPDQILISPLLRAYRTFVLSQLRCSNTRLEGRLLEYEWDLFPAYPTSIYAEIDSLVDIDNTKWHEVAFSDRVSSLVNELKTSEFNRIVLFSHYNTINELLIRILGIEHSKSVWLPIDNTSITQIEMSDNSIKVINVNNTMHLH